MFNLKVLVGVIVWVVFFNNNRWCFDYILFMLFCIERSVKFDYDVINFFIERFKLGKVFIKCWINGLNDCFWRVG